MNKLNQNIITTSSKENTERKIWNILSEVNDPEIPVLSIIDLGILREVKMDYKTVNVIITPTYSGCPALDFIGMNIRKALSDNGFDDIKITHQLSPAWTTDWMTEEGKKKLKMYGIAPPVAKSFDKNYLENIEVECPHCNSINTVLVSQFGSTACKALYRCNNCGEPFDYFKCH